MVHAILAGIHGTPCVRRVGPGFGSFRNRLPVLGLPAPLPLSFCTPTNGGCPVASSKYFHRRPRVKKTAPVEGGVAMRAGQTG
jgi:hypothetical protein